mgnify:CR=1 FL=1
MDALACTKAVQAAVNKLGSGFMMDGATFARAPEVGLDPGLPFYVIGRFGALGRVHADVVAAAAAFFEPAATAGYWDSSVAKCDPSVAAGLFYECADAWGRAKLAGVAGLERADGEPLPVALRLPYRFDRRTLNDQHVVCSSELRSRAPVVDGPGRHCSSGGQRPRYLE